MADAFFSHQPFRKIALVIGYSLVAAFGAASMLIAEQRPLDERGQLMVAIVGGGALLAALLVMLNARHFLRLPKIARFAAIFIGIALATVLMQALLAGGLFNFTAFAERDPVTTFEGLAELAFFSAYGFIYYLVYGSALALPVGLGAAFLFALGFLTLRPPADRTDR